MNIHTVNRQNGFTLIELLVVLVILAVLGTAVVQNLSDEPDKARLVKAKQDILTIESALSRYKLDNFVYPTSDEGLDALVNKPASAKKWNSNGYIKRLPKDPWDNAYQYLNPGVNGPIDIYSLGADGQQGGEGIEADIGNWNLQ